MPIPRLPFPRPAEDPESLSNLANIDTIVVLMQENRSFDHMLGYLRHAGPGRFRPHLTLGRTKHPDDVSNWVRLLDS